MEPIVSVQIPRATVSSLDHLAKATGRSRSAVIRLLVSEGLERALNEAAPRELQPAAAHEAHPDVLS